MVEFVGDILTKYLQGADGKKAYERLGTSTWNSEKLSCGYSVLGVWRLGQTEVVDSPPVGLSWQPCRRVQGLPARATG